MNTPRTAWRNLSPGDLSISLPEIDAGEVQAAIGLASACATQWARTSVDERIERMRAAQQQIMASKEGLAHGIALETGKPITEALGEVGAVIAKIDLTIADAGEHLAEKAVPQGP